MRYSSVLCSMIILVVQPLLSEVRLTFVNETPYGVFVHYTTEWEQVTVHTPKEIEVDTFDIRQMVRSHNRSYKGAPVYIAPHSRYLLYHAGAVTARSMYLEAVDPLTKKVLGMRLYCEGVSHEKYDAGWLYQQVWQDGDRWNWTLWIKAE